MDGAITSQETIAINGRFPQKNKDFSIGSYVLKEMSKRIELEKGTSIKVSSSLFFLLLAVSNVLWYKFAHYFFTWLA